jgi:GT2 family glycosyltransferase
MAAHWLISRKCLLKVGGFSPTFPHYGEDDNMIQRVYFWNFRAGIVPMAKAVHDREHRLESKKHKIYMQYIAALIQASNPNTQGKAFLIRMIYKQIKSTLKCRNIKPLSFAFRLCKELPTIKKNRKISMTQNCAFLKCPEIG